MKIPDIRQEVKVSLQSVDILIIIAISNLQIGIKRESQVQDTYRYNDKNIHTLQNRKVWIFLSL